jgi:hypothetical protein
MAGGVGPYELTSAPHTEIDQFLTVGSEATGTPENLQGLWWMDGNPLADEVVSFASAQYEKTYEDGEFIGWTVTIPVYDEGIWSWHDTGMGRLLYNLVRHKQLTYVGLFNKDFTFGQISPVIKVFPGLPDVKIPQSMLVDFTMTQVAQDEWRRDSVLLGAPSSYRFRRIVDGSGQRLPAWDEYVAAIEDRGPENALLPVCQKDDGSVLPTACAR